MKVIAIAVTTVVVLSLAIGFGASAQQRGGRQSAKLYGDVERGQKLAAMWCADCHGTASTANDRPPSFVSLAANPRQSDVAIRAFLMQPHRPMPPLELSNQQIEDIIVYLHTLGPKAAGAK